MTYNIHHGEGLDGKLDLERIARVIKREGAELVALQEVDKGVARTQRRNLPGELAALTGMACVFSNNFHYQGGEYGNAILTKFPVRCTTNLHYRMIRPGEQRGLLQVTVEVHGRNLIFMNTHIDYRGDDSERVLNVEQIGQVRDTLQSPQLVSQSARQGKKSTPETSRNHPIILCGDFNDNPGSRIHTRLKERFDDAWELIGIGDGWSYPTAKPVKRIDYIWISKGGQISPVRVWVPRDDASDHLPVVAELKIEPASKGR